MSYGEVADKFRGCAEFAKWPRSRTDAVIAFVRTMERAPDLGQLGKLLACASPEVGLTGIR